MANFELMDTKVATITILTVDAAGEKVPAIAGDVFTVVSSDPTKLKAEMGVDIGGGAAVVLTPMVRTASAITVTVSDTDHLTTDVQIVDVVDDLTPSAVSLDLAGAVLTTQAAPAV